MASKTLHVDPKGEIFGRRYVWQLPVRITHWADALAITVLFSTGIYIGSPILSPNGEAWHNFLMGRFREFHFIFAYVFLCAWLLRSYWFWSGNNYARSGFPMVWKKSWWHDLRSQMWAYIKNNPGAPHLGHNALGGFTYTFTVILIGAFQLVTGFGLYSETHPGGFWDHVFGWVIPLLGGPMSTRTWHHLAAWAFAVFVMIHVYIVFYDGTNYRSGLISSMISGYKYYKDGDEDNDTWIS